MSIDSLVAESVLVGGGDAELTAYGSRAALRLDPHQVSRRSVFVSLPVWFEDGAIELDVIVRLRDDAPPHAHAEACLAYRVDPVGNGAGRVQVRPLHGAPEQTPSPYSRRDALLVGATDWPFQELASRVSDPDDPSWTHLRVEVDGPRLTATTDGGPELSIPVVRAALPRGEVGLYVGDWTEAYFSNLRVIPA